MKQSGVGADERPAVVEMEDEEGNSRRKNVSSGSRAEQPKKKLDSSLTRSEEKVLDTEERIERALQKGSHEGSDVQLVVESMSDEWHVDDYTEIETGATSTNTDTRQGPEE